MGPITTIGPFVPPGDDTSDPRDPGEGGPGGGGGGPGGGGGGGPGGGGGGGGLGAGGGGPGGVDSENPPPVIISPPVVQAPGLNTVLPSVPTVDEAIDQVIKCNCDCWDILGQ